MAFTSLTNGCLLIISLALNNYAAFPSVLAGTVVTTFTYMVERFIVTSTKPLTAVSFAYRAILFFVMVGLHLIFVDLAFFRQDLIPIAQERFEAKNQAEIASYDEDFIYVNGKIETTINLIDALDTDKKRRQDAPLKEVRGEGSTGLTGRSTIAIYEEEAYDRYYKETYQPDSSKLASRLNEYNSQSDSLSSLVNAIAQRSFDYGQLGLTTKMTCLAEFASRKGNESVPKIMLLLILVVAAIEFAPLYARYRLEFSEYNEDYERQRKLQRTVSEKETRAKIIAERMKIEAIQAAAATNQLHENAMQQAEDRFAFAKFQVDFVRRAELERSDARQGLSQAGKQRIDEIFDRLRADLIIIFGKPNMNI